MSQHEKEDMSWGRTSPLQLSWGLIGVTGKVKDACKEEHAVLQVGWEAQPAEGMESREDPACQQRLRPDPLPSPWILHGHENRFGLQGITHPVKF